MNQDLVVLFGWNIIINSLLAFITVALLVELVMVVFRIKHHRLRAFCRCIPIMKVVSDLFLYDFGHWALAWGINPLHAVPGTRVLSVQMFNTDPLSWMGSLIGIQLRLMHGLTFSLADCLALMMERPWISGTVMCMLCIGLGSLLWKGYAYHVAKKHVMAILNHSKSCVRAIENPSIVWELEKRQVRVLESEDSITPFCTMLSGAMIVLPTSLLQELDQNEFEAVLAHELEHLRLHDSLLRRFLDVICALFWWLPTRWSRQAIENAQESACDESIKRYGIRHLDLASALTKAMRSTLPLALVATTSLFGIKAHVATRLQQLLKPSSEARMTWKEWLTAGLVTVLLLGRFWIF